MGRSVAVQSGAAIRARRINTPRNSLTQLRITVATDVACKLLRLPAFMRTLIILCIVALLKIEQELTRRLLRRAVARRRRTGALRQ